MVVPTGILNPTSRLSLCTYFTQPASSCSYTVLSASLIGVFRASFLGSQEDTRTRIKPQIQYRDHEGCVGPLHTCQNPKTGPRYPCPILKDPRGELLCRCCRHISRWTIPSGYKRILAQLRRGPYTSQAETTAPRVT